MLHQCKKSRTSSLHLQLETPETETLNATPQKNRTLWQRCGRRKGGGVQKHSVKSGIVIVSREEHRNRSHVPACQLKACVRVALSQRCSQSSRIQTVYCTRSRLEEGCRALPTWTLHFPMQISKRTSQQRVCCPPRALAPPRRRPFTGSQASLLGFQSHYFFWREHFFSHFRSGHDFLIWIH